MRILIVDDDYVSGVKLKAILAAYGDCDLAPSGQIALELIEAATESSKYYDLIMLDLHLPDISGQDVLYKTRSLENKLLKNLKISENSKVVVVTGSSDKSEMLRILSIGADKYLQKPFNYNSIKTVLDELEIVASNENKPSGGARRMLIVEDSYENSLLLKGALGPYGDCDLAPTGSIALALFSEARKQGIAYEFIALDLNLPDMSGNKILKLIRSVEKLDKARGTDHHAYIVVISASKDRNSIIEAAQNGVNSYILKPFSFGNIKVELSKAGFQVPQELNV